MVTIPDLPDAMTTETFASTVNFILEMVMHIRRMDEQAEPPCKKARNQEGQVYFFQYFKIAEISNHHNKK